MSREFNEKKPPGAYIEEKEDVEKQQLPEQKTEQEQSLGQSQQNVELQQQDLEKQQQQKHLEPKPSTTLSSIYTGSNFAPAETPLHKDDPARGITPIPDEQITDVPQRGGLYKVQTLFDRVLPERRRYCGHSRRYCLYVLGVVMLLILALIITLSVALTRGKHTSRRTNSAPGAPQRGSVTYYDPGLGACGEVHANGNAVAAISVPMWNTGAHGSNPNNNSNCRRQILITNVNGRAVNAVVTVVDRCVGCAIGDIDVSRSVFAGVANLEKGRTSVEWHFIT